MSRVVNYELGASRKGGSLRGWLRSITASRARLHCGRSSLPLCGVCCSLAAAAAAAGYCCSLGFAVRTLTAECLPSCSTRLSWVGVVGQEVGELLQQVVVRPEQDGHLHRAFDKESVRLVM